MIDALYKQHMDRFWDAVGRAVARRGITPDAVTLAGFFLNALNAWAFTQHQNTVAFGLLLAVIELLDNVDGAVARVTGTSSKAGAFLDATTDRYKEIFPFLAIAWVTGYGLSCFLAVTGSLMVSYAQARADAEDPNREKPTGGLPDFFERLERLATLCFGLVFAPLFSPDFLFGEGLLFGVLWLLAVMTHLTAFQRMARGYRALRNGAVSAPPTSPT